MARRAEGSKRAIRAVERRDVVGHHLAQPLLRVWPAAKSSTSHKVGRLAGEVVNLAPDHNDVARAAAALGRPTKTLWAQAWSLAQRDLG